MEQQAKWTTDIADFVANTVIDWSEQLKQAVLDGVLDWYASTLTAHDDPIAEQLKSVLGYNSGSVVGIANGSTVLGRRYRLAPLDSALINGYLAHALDYDDVHEDVRGHPSAVLLPALFAEAEARTVSGRSLMEGYLIGLEVMCRLGKAVGSKHYELGWHSTATLGAIASACAVARMCHLSFEQTIHAISIAATQSSGLRLQFGTAIKPMHAGFAARAGLLAARMAEANIKGAAEVLAGDIGLLSLFTEQKVNGIDIKQWQKQWSILSPGLWYKKYPCCSAAYHAIDAADELRQKYKLSLDQIEAITIIYPPGGDTALIHRQPKNGVEGKFSAEYITILKLIQDELTFEQFSARAIPLNIQAVMKKTTREYRKDIVASEQAMPKGRYTLLEVKLKTGECLTAYCECPTGSPAKPMTSSDHQYKLNHALQHVDKRWTSCYKRLLTLFTCTEVKHIFES